MRVGSGEPHDSTAAGQRAANGSRIHPACVLIERDAADDVEGVARLPDPGRGPPLRETSANRFTRKEKRTGRPQIDELLSTARVPVFLLDQDQVVRPGELGTVADIEVAARERGIDVMKINLDAQFRCGRSLAFVHWTQSLLGLTDGPVEHWGGDDDFEVNVMASPTELEQWLVAHQEGGYTARMAAGYCWSWSDPRPDGTLVDDVQIGSWSRPWNLKADRGVGGAPPSAL
ncbi:hypothetical protein GCM10025862_42190 [Arsenicicoccus piscis]|uniref:Schlafen group 3-like DNA/RNA helicase domain-containing protein n=1 Tax=Arsenicicoccus piscis TaxID=673954 RepID=A0ABQ6HUH7_9MICO|nr:hypothetical protein GCM10025862_35520 [Arsenicicoccus piscis]GMA22149.1 hypothetical protein GCM10025862_41720 [Arsenicicoccus piscis]GMA22196.1 hypothetical protein GCM10025862_42190 [Arsenicicoccus piscis]